MCERCPMQIRVGVQLHPQHTTVEALTAAAREIDELEFDTLWTWDHFYPLYGVEGAPMGDELPEGVDPPERGSHFEGWTLLAAWAAQTSNAELGMLVTCNSYRNPQLLADMARTVDHISGGRTILGIGSGWYEKDYEEYGYEFGTAVSRLQDLRRNLPMIEERMKQLLPRPLRNPMPIMIGGGGEKVTLRLVAKHAAMWNYFGTPEQMAHKCKVLDEWCEKEGRDPRTIERSLLATSPDFIDRLDDYVAAGITHFILGLGTPFNLQHAHRLLEYREKMNRVPVGAKL